MSFKEYMTEGKKFDAKGEAKKMQAMKKKLGDIDGNFLDAVIKYKYVDEPKSKIHRDSVSIASMFVELEGRLKDFGLDLVKLAKKELK